ncbi:hypothetical protein HZC31_02140 [Candidatus Woesearchaeota archaeon]|nr:hypothetical protein [Candidatus Woesearchaeota archaeon]
MATLGDIISNPVFWLICAFFVLALVYSLRSYIRALGTSLFFDYGIDAGLSFWDELLGIGITGLDVGDWVGGVLMFLKYRQQVGTGWALLFLAEAANFGLSLIPGIGEGFEFFFNMIPLATFVVLIKQHQANQVYNSIKEYADYLKQEQTSSTEGIKKELQEIDSLYNSCSYQQLFALGAGIREGLAAEVKQIIQTKLSRAQQHVMTTLQKEVQLGTGKIHQQDIAAVSTAIQRALEELETDWKQADTDANQILHSVSSLVYQVQQESPAEPADVFKEAA